MGYRLAAALLSLLLLLQISAMWYVNGMARVRVGSRLDDIVDVSQRNVNAGPICRVMFVVDPQCPASRSAVARMSKGVAVISPGPESADDEFVRLTRKVERVLPVKSEYSRFGGNALSRLGVGAVPTRIVVNSAGTIVDVSLEQSIPDSTELVSICGRT